MSKDTLIKLAMTANGECFQATLMEDQVQELVSLCTSMIEDLHDIVDEINHGSTAYDRFPILVATGIVDVTGVESMGKLEDS